MKKFMGLIVSIALLASLSIIRKLHSIKSSMVGDLKYSRGEAFSCKEYIKKSLDDALMYLFENYEPIAKLKRQFVMYISQTAQQVSES